MSSTPPPIDPLHPLEPPHDLNNPQSSVNQNQAHQESQLEHLILPISAAESAENASLEQEQEMDNQIEQSIADQQRQENDNLEGINVPIDDNEIRNEPNPIEENENLIPDDNDDENEQNEDDIVIDLDEYDEDDDDDDEEDDEEDEDAEVERGFINDLANMLQGRVRNLLRRRHREPNNDVLAEYLVADDADNNAYDQAEMPAGINFDTNLPTSHEYLGQNFEEVTSKAFHQQYDEITIPILSLPGSDDSASGYNNVQLLPGQTIPIYFYAPLQVQMIKKRLKEADQTVGFVLVAPAADLNEQQQQNANINRDEIITNLGILGEIISAQHESEQTDGENSGSSMMPGMDGLILKVRGRERFKILKMRRDVTGCLMATVRILPDYSLGTNPLVRNASSSSTAQLLRNYLENNTNKPQSNAKTTFLNWSNPFPVWVYRRYDCDYIISQIKRELNDSFQQVTPSFSSSNEDSNDFVYTDPFTFSNWLLNNFPFDNTMRINCLKFNCVNQRLSYMHSLLQRFTNINCVNCHIQICSKSDVFCMSKQGFMQAYLNPGGYVHETLTVYKAKNLHLVGAHPSTAHSWFPGYAWTIVQCRQCFVHIGWKFTSTRADLIPDKFWGLTRKAVCHTVEENEPTTNQPTATL